MGIVDNSLMSTKPTGFIEKTSDPIIAINKPLVMHFSQGASYVPIPTITNPAANNVQLPRQNLTVHWHAPNAPGAIIQYL